MSEGARWLTEQIKEGTAPIAAGKMGTSELEIFIWFLHDSKLQLPSDRQLKNFLINAGFWIPAGKPPRLFLELWSRKIMQALEEMDGLVRWNGDFEKALFDIYSTKSQKLALRDLEPYYHPIESRWTLALPEGSTLAVVSPFATSIQQQLGKLDKVWPAADVWKAGQRFALIRTCYGPHLDLNGSAGWPQEIVEKGPFEAVKKIVADVLAKGATHAMVGCGAISLLVCNELKKKGVTAIHTGGATQIFFGVLGNRWVEHEVIKGFINDAWIRPSADEIPQGAMLVEKGCYW